MEFQQPKPYLDEPATGQEDIAVAIEGLTEAEVEERLAYDGDFQRLLFGQYIRKRNPDYKG